MVRNTAAIVGIEAMAAAQGIELKRDAAQPVRSSALVEAEFARVRRQVEFLGADRLLAPDLRTMQAWAEQGPWPAPIAQLFD
jgi:histidine ammonia-lyase